MSNLMKSLEAFRQSIGAPVTNAEMIRLALAGSKANFADDLPADHVAALSLHTEKLGEFLKTEDGCDLWTLFLDSFKRFVESDFSAEP